MINKGRPRFYTVACPYSIHHPQLGITSGVLRQCLIPGYTMDHPWYTQVLLMDSSCTINALSIHSLYTMT